MKAQHRKKAKKMKSIISTGKSINRFQREWRYGQSFCPHFMRCYQDDGD